MKETYSAVIKQSGSWWIGWIERGSWSELSGTDEGGLDPDAKSYTPRSTTRGGGGGGGGDRILKKSLSRYEARTASFRHLRSHGCRLLREGARNSWCHHPAQNKR